MLEHENCYDCQDHNRDRRDNDWQPIALPPFDRRYESGSCAHVRSLHL